MSFTPQAIPWPTSKRRPRPTTPALAVVPALTGETVPTSSLTGFSSSRCMTVTKPLDSLNTAVPLDRLSASALPQCSVIACRAFPLMSGIRTEMLAVPAAGFHCST